jgi:acetolactate synthase regulatory subunit
VRFALTVVLASGEGALLRALGLVGRRGFALRRVSARAHADGTMEVELEGDDHGRDPDVLVRQLARLVDVVSVTRELVT